MARTVLFSVYILVVVQGLPLSRFTQTDNLAASLKSQATNLESVLKKISTTDSASKYIKDILGEGSCIKTLDEALKVISIGVDILEDSEPQLKNLLESLNSIGDDTDILTTTRVTAKVLGQIDVLLPSLSNKFSSFCSSSSDALAVSLTKVGRILDEVEKDSSLKLPVVTKLRLQEAKEYLSAVENFMKKINQSFGSQAEICKSGKDHSQGALTSLGEMLEGLADLFRTLGGYQEADNIREKSKFTETISEAFKNPDLKELVALDCESSGDYGAVAKLMEDLANIIEDVGEDFIKEYLGLETLI